MQNIEFKAELRDPLAARAKCRDIGAQFINRLEQTDTYFRIPEGRLKKRETVNEPTEWIHYLRSDRARPRMSHFTIHSDADAKTRWGLANLRTWVIVRKTRDLYLFENVRIHLDEVEDLGAFLEFEAQVGPKFTVEKCHARIANLREQFAPTLGETISGSYSDLLDRQRREAGR